MTQQYSTRAQRIIMLITLLVLILVIAKNVAAGTTCAVSQKTTVKENNEGIKEKMIKKVVAEIEDMPWRPVISFLR